MQKRLGVLLAVVLLTAVGLGGCSNAEHDPQKQTAIVRLYEVYPSLLHAPQYVAITQAIFAEEGLEVEITLVPGAKELITALQEGHADIGLAGAETSIQVYQQGQEDYLINFSQLTQREGSFLLGHNREAEFQWEDLRGKSIIIGHPGGRQEMVLEYILKQHGLNPGKDVDIITDLHASEAFMQGKGDYVVLGEPAATELEKEDAGYAAASIGTASGDIPDTVYVARKSLLKKNPELIQKFSNAVYQAQVWVDSHSPVETAQVIAPFFPDMKLDDLAAAVERYQQHNTWRVTTVMDEQSFNFLQEIIITAGEMDTVVEPSIVINNDFAKKAVLYNKR